MKDVLDWTVVGAGPAGIAAVGMLIDGGVSPKKIGWIDPHFEVGDLGRKWNRVPSNTKVELFNRFLHHCRSFEFKSRPSKFSIEDLDPKDTCPLQQIVDPLQWVTDQLKEKVHSVQEMALELELTKGRWEIKLHKGTVLSKNVVLAIGSDSRGLSHAGPEPIGLDTALNPEKLKHVVHAQDTVAVFGASHSAILILASLLQGEAKKVINFYRSPHRYAVYLDDWILFDDTGLKGFTANWARKHLDGELPKRLQRVLVSDPIFQECLASCTKVVYAVGFDRRKLPIVKQFGALHYDDKTGIIAPGLFGVGIAFPQSKFDPLGHLQFGVGLWKFMDYLNKILPIWLKYSTE